MTDTTLPAPAPRAPGPSWGDRVRETVSSYLPLLLMGALALSTWWLVKNTPAAPEPPDQRPVTHEPDYTMDRFTLQRYGADGRLRIQIEGDRLRHYLDTDTLEIDVVRVRAVAADGGVTLAKANRALSNGAGTEIELMGNAQVTRAADTRGPAIEFRGEYLQALLETDRLHSNLPVLLRRGGDEIHAAGLDYDHRTRVAVLPGPMRAILLPPQAASAPR